MQLNGTRQLLVDADDNMLGGSVHVVKENGEALVVVSMETGQEVTADICMYVLYMVMSQDQNAGRNHRLIRVPLKGWKSSNIWEKL